MAGKATIELHYPARAEDAALVLVEQAWMAITEGYLVITNPKRDRDGLHAWLRGAAAVLGKSDNRQQELQPMFNITAKPVFTRLVPVMVPVDGGHREESLKVTFRALPTDEAATFDLATGAGSAEFMRAAIVMIDDVVDDQKKPMPYNDALREQLIMLPYVRVALARSYMEAVAKAKSGN